MAALQFGQMRRYRGSLLALLAGFVLELSLPAEADVSSYAFVQSDGSLRISGQTYRLYGIHVPRTDETCLGFTRPLECDTRAALALDFKIGVDFVRCEDRTRNADGSISAVCRANGEDLAAYLLERGLAVAMPNAPFEYVTLERIARSRGIGLWGIALD